MKKIFWILSHLLVLTLLCACGNENINTPSDSTPATEPSQTEEPKNEIPDFIPEGVTVFQKFEAPTQDPDEYRQVARDYMYSMYNIKWTPAETFTITWQKTGNFGVNLQFKKGTEYYGIPYSRARSPLCEFTSFISNDGTYKCNIPDTFNRNKYYYESTVGNNCSASMVLAYQQLLNMPKPSYLQPSDEYRDFLEFPTKLEEPSGKWYSEDFFKINKKDKIFEAYSLLEKGDILNKSASSSAHSRMVESVFTEYKSDGSINPKTSYIETLEQTNEFDSTRKDGVKTTWWIDHKYTFDQLYSTQFMPVTLCIFHTKEPLEDAYIWLEGVLPTPDTIITNGITCNINSNFPISFTKLTITNENGENVREIFHYGQDKLYSDSFRKELLKLSLNELPKGKYTYKLEAGIARGACTLDSFEFIVK